MRISYLRYPLVQYAATACYFSVLAYMRNHELDFSQRMLRSFARSESPIWTLAGALDAASESASERVLLGRLRLDFARACDWKLALHRAFAELGMHEPLNMCELALCVEVFLGEAVKKEAQPIPGLFAQALACHRQMTRDHPMYGSMQEASRAYCVCSALWNSFYAIFMDYRKDRPENKGGQIPAA